MDFEQQILRALPGCYLVLDPGQDFKILEASDAYLKAVGKNRDIIGQPLFNIFPDNPDDFSSTGLQTLKESLNKVIETRHADRMPLMRYKAVSPESGKPETKFWSPINSPVPGASGEVQYIIHAVEDVSDRESMKKRLHLRDHTTQQQITDAISTTQELERMEISRELHDNINQILVAAKWYLGRAVQKEQVEKKMVQSGIDLITNAMDEIRELSTALVETSQEEKSLVHTLDHLMDHLMATGALNVQKKIRLPDESLIESKVKTTVIRIVQEQLANVMKHADARNLFIELSFRDHNLYLSVKDDGKGFHLRDIQQGMGFQNMRSRVAFMNGSLHIHSSPGDGCQIEVHIPVRKVRMRDDGEREVDS